MALLLISVDKCYHRIVYYDLSVFGGVFPPRILKSWLKGEDMNDFIAFRKMVTPVIIQGIFWIGAAASVLGGLGMVVSGIGSEYGGGAKVLIGLAIMLMGPLFVRVYCELLIVIFRIYGTLVDIKDAIGNKGSGKTE